MTFYLVTAEAHSMTNKKPNFHSQLIVVENLHDSLRLLSKSLLKEEKSNFTFPAKILIMAYKKYPWL